MFGVKQSEMPNLVAERLRRWNDVKYALPYTNQTKKVFGIIIAKNFMPGINKEPGGLMLVKGNRLYGISFGGRAFALFRNKGKWCLRRGESFRDIFVRVMFENSPLIPASEFRDQD